ncbi:hypothetical protein HK100_001225 [Physocladia obscura]|uniref:BZIP domain-containing protein n=1 Tax=Physocladia obscura TaxID=109957 RepID=A0AAD5XBZ7_9FUNG|nr:hypothetical protein HK100_001225 [Physocladia obscura]
MSEETFNSTFSAEPPVGLKIESKKRGRQLCEDTSDKRRSQIREAQRSYRKRQQEYIADLERKVAELTAQISNNSPRQLYSNPEAPAQTAKDCCACYLTNIDLANKNSELIREVIALKDEARQVKEPLGCFLLPSHPVCPQSTVVSPPQSNSTVSPYLENSQQTTKFVIGKKSAVNRISDLINSDDVISSAGLYGYLDLAPFHAELKAIEALKDCKLVDEIIVVISGITNCTSRTGIKRHILEIARLKYHLMDLCSLNERTRVVNVFESNKGSGNFNNHWRHWYQSVATGVEFENKIPDIDSPYLSDELRALVDVTRKFRDTCAEIPSLLNNLYLVNALCVVQSMRFLCVDKKERDELFSTWLVMQGLLQVLCETNVERTKFMVALEVTRDRLQKRALELKEEL